MIQGKPQALKQVNLSAVRKAILDSGSATRAEIVALTQISVTTVRALLLEMLESGEIVETGQDASSGGRKAVRYRLNKSKYYGLAICVARAETRWFLVDICGDVCESGSLGPPPLRESAIFELVDALTKRVQLKSIGLGVPGIPSGLAYWRATPAGQMEKHRLGAAIQEKYGIPVVLESDLSALSFGFARAYRHENPNKACEDLHMAYLYFEEGCPSAGFISHGRPLRGWRNYSGELGFFPLGKGRKLNDSFGAESPNDIYTELAAKLISGICCVLNPQYIALGGNFRRQCLGGIQQWITAFLPAQMLPELLIADAFWQDYALGMAALSAEAIFKDVRLVHASDL